MKLVSKLSNLLLVYFLFFEGFLNLQSFPYINAKILEESSCGCSSLEREEGTDFQIGKKFSKDETVSSKIEEDSSLIDMVFIPEGEFYMGSEDSFIYPSDGESPLRRVFIDSFYLDETEVTNEMFSQFVKVTQLEITCNSSLKTQTFS